MAIDVSRFKIDKSSKNEKYKEDLCLLKDPNKNTRNQYDSYDVTDAITIMNISKEMLSRMQDLAAGISGLPVSVQIVPGRGTFITYSLNKQNKRIGATINIDLGAVVDDIIYVVNNIRKTGKKVNWLDVEAIVKKDFYHEMAHLLLTESLGNEVIYDNYFGFFENPLKRKIYTKVIGFVFNACEDARIETQIIDIFPGMIKYFEFSYSYMINHKIIPMEKEASEGNIGKLVFLALLSPYLLGLGYESDQLIHHDENAELLKVLNTIQPYCLEFSQQKYEKDAVEIMAKNIWPPIRDFIDSYYEDAEQLSQMIQEMIESGEIEVDMDGEGSESGSGSGSFLPGLDLKSPSKEKEGKEGEGKLSNKTASSKETTQNQKPPIGETYSEDLDSHEHTTGGNVLTDKLLEDILKEVEQYLSKVNPAVTETTSYDQKQSEQPNPIILPELIQYTDFTTERQFVKINADGSSPSVDIQNYLSSEEQKFKQNILPQLRKVLQDNERMGYAGAYNSGKHLNQKRILKYTTNRDMRIFQRVSSNKKKDYVFHFVVDGSGSMGSLNLGSIDKIHKYNPPCFTTAVVSYCFAQALQSLSIPLRIDVWDSGGYTSNGTGIEVFNSDKMNVYPNDEVTFRIIKDYEEIINPLFQSQKSKLAGFMGNGGTPEYDAIAFGIESLSKRPEQVKILVSLTDGAPGSYVGSRQQREIISSSLYPKADKLGINIFAIGFGHSEITHHRQTAIIKQTVTELQTTVINILRSFIN